jgi:hypothetical protein
MGIFGWDVVSPSTQLAGTLQSHHYSGGGGWFSFNDYDSNLEVQPAPGYEHLAVNRAGVQNAQGIIECEIHVARQIPDTPTEATMFEDCVNKPVVVTGLFVEDRSHNNETEIHPIDSLLVDFGTNGTTRQVRFCAFSDDWAQVTSQLTAPPFARTDRVGEAVIEFPAGPPGLVPHYTATVNPISAYRSADLNVITGADGRSYLHVLVHTGTPDHQGLYWADLTLDWQPAGLWHTIRHANGGWDPEGNVKGQIGDPGDVIALAATSAATAEAQFMLGTQDGRLWHTIRHANGGWDHEGDVKGQIGDVGQVVAVAATSAAAGEVQFMLAAQDGRLWHTIRHASGGWDRAGDLKGQIGDPGHVIAVAGTSAATGEARFMLATQDGHLWHTIRHANGSWDHEGDVKGQIGDRGGVIAVAATSRSARGSAIHARDVMS